MATSRRNTEVMESHGVRYTKVSTTNCGPRFPHVNLIIPAHSGTGFSAWVTRTWQLGSLQPSQMLLHC